MTRPDLTGGLSAEEFRSYYWLKQELVSFCRAHGLGTHGAKLELAERISTFLETGQRRAASARPAAPKGKMPATFSHDTVIGPGWRCSEGLRAFFQAEIGPHFHFNQALRDVIRHGAGRTLQQAIDAWHAAEQLPRGTGEIAAQFEYNRHMRAFFHAHPAATRAEALRAWKEQRARRRSDAARAGEGEPS